MKVTMATRKEILILIFLVSSFWVHAQDTISLKPYFRQLRTIEVSMNGKKYNFLFDSGGGETFISPEIAQTLNKEVYGSSTGIRMDGEMFKYKKQTMFLLNLALLNYSIKRLVFGIS